METSVSPAPSTTERKGFKKLVAKAKLGRKDTPSTTSLNGSNISDETSERAGIRNSVDSLMDKVRDSRGSSLDDGLPSGPSNLSKLIPGRAKKKRKKREEAEQQLQQEAADPRGRSVDGETATSAGPTTLSKDNTSQSALGEDDEEDGGSLITIESDTEPTTISPPPLVSHQSHIGFLTSSSPLINTTTHGDAPTNLQLDSPTFQNPQYQKPPAVPAKGSNSSSTTNLAPDHAATMTSRDGARRLSTRDGSKTRGVSPGARIKDVFTVGSKKKDTSPPKSPDRASMSGSGNALQALFNKDKRNSISLGRSSKASDSKESVVSNLQSPSASVRDIPAIVTTPNTPTSASLDPPETHVTPPTPIDQRQDVPSNPPLIRKAPGSAGANQNTSSSTSAHRRVRSDSGTLSSSKLSNVMSAPLTPMAEERTPGGRTPSQGSQAGGFFSSVFSAAQNAANQISSTIANNPARSRSSTQTIEEDGDEHIDGATSVVAEDAPVDEQKKLAVETLGAGDLSLSHLGIGLDSPPTKNASTTTLQNGLTDKAQEGSMVHREEAAAQAENVSAARAVSQAYSLKPTEETVSTPVAEDVAPVVRPRSVYESSIMTGDKTPPNGSMYEGSSGFRRSGSVRSRVGTIAKRHRNSSSATGGTIAAAIAAGNAAVANPAASGSNTKPTGFAVASKKRNRDFHQLFRSVPEDDYLIEDYSCALQRDIILAGRIYISEGHICFSSNILGWVTTLIISFDEVVSVEKENTAMVFPNAIAIQTLHARQTFRSLLSREATYDLLIGIWKINHPSLKSSLNGVRLEGGTGDKTEKVDPSGSDEASEGSDEEEEIYDEDEDEDDDEGTGSFTEVPEGSVAGSELAPDQPSKAVTRKASAMGVAAGAAAGGGPTPSESKAGEKAAAASAASADFPGPATHAPTECGDGASHYDRPLQDDIIPAPLGKVYSMTFGAASGGFMAKWLLDEIKVTDLTMEDDKKGLSEENRTRSYSYIKPLNASIGPKSTKCVVTETLESFDLEKAVSITQSTQTPDVPSGNVFATKTHFCLMWAPGNATRLVINFTIEWTGKSWLKGPIEKGANDGQTTYCNDLVKALKTGVTSRPRAGTNGSKLKSKGKRRKGDADPARISPANIKAVATGAQPKDSSWGLFEPLHGILSPLFDIFSPMISSNMVIGFLLFIILINWFRTPRSSASNNGLAYIPTAQKIAAYEEIWRKEESDLWDWLEERVGMQGVSYPESTDREAVAQARRQREQSLRNKGLRSKLEDMKMSEREVDHAIKVTEQKLEVLKRAVQEKKGVQEDVNSPSRAADETDRPETEV